jgi:hypothetical protein
MFEDIREFFKKAVDGMRLCRLQYVCILGVVILVMQTDPRWSWADVIGDISHKGAKMRVTLLSRANGYCNCVLAYATTTKPPPGL